MAKLCGCEGCVAAGAGFESSAPVRPPVALPFPLPVADACFAVPGPGRAGSEAGVLVAAWGVRLFVLSRAPARLPVALPLVSPAAFTPLAMPLVVAFAAPAAVPLTVLPT